MITETEGATFAPGDGELDIAEVVTREGMEKLDLVVEDEEVDQAFVLS